MKRFGKLRFWLLWFVIGLVGLVVVYPSTMKVRSGGFFSAEKHPFENVMTALPCEAEDNGYQEYACESAPCYEMEEDEHLAPGAGASDEGVFSEVFGNAAENLGNAEGHVANEAEELSHLFGITGNAQPPTNFSGEVMSGTGEGGGGTGHGIGIGSIGSIGSGGSGAGAPPTTAMASAQTHETVTVSQSFNGRASVKPKTKSFKILPPKSAAPKTEGLAASEPIIDELEPAASDFGDAGAGFDEMLAEVDRKLASLPLANIAFNTPKQIPLGDYSEIELLVSLKEAEEQLAKAVAAPGPVETSRVRVSPYLEARLSGVGFRVESSTPPRQMLSRTQRTRWQWQIEPTKADTLKLDLTLNAMITIDGEKHERAIETFRREILVDVPIGQRVVQVVSNNQEMLATVLVIPVGGWLWRRYRKGRKDPPGDDTPEIRQAA